jgi:hypothetical protein
MAPTTNLSQCPALDGLDFYLRPLSVADVKACVTVENAFPENERCSEEKVNPRLPPRTPSQKVRQSLN